MSVWTHVSGIIRLNGWYRHEDIEEWLSKPAGYYEDATSWDNCRLPMGSEGSLEWEFIRRKDIYNLVCNSHVIFYGDLRDFSVEDCKQIEVWWDNIFKTPVKQLVLNQIEHKSLISHRGAILQYYTEGDDVYHVLQKKDL